MTDRLITTPLMQMTTSSPAGESAQDAQDAPTGALWSPSVSVDKTVVISDLHLGIDDRYSETIANRTLLLDFLTRLEKTTDVRELVINGDFLDEWYLPLTYKRYEDSAQFYRQVIETNQHVIDTLNNLMAKGIKLVYVPGNHDMLLPSQVLDEALPGIVQARDADGLGAYTTGDRQEIVIEHCHRYDALSAPDSVSNRELCQTEQTLLPPGYFYARIAASWVLQGRPLIKKDYPVITDVPDADSNPDQFGAYLYYKLLSSEFARITQFERFEDRIFDLGVAGFNGNYSLEDFYPVRRTDGTISAPVLYKDFQRTWPERQHINQIPVTISFLEAIAGVINKDFYFHQAKRQYLENSSNSIDVVVFGHTHIPDFRRTNDGFYINAGTWIDHNTSYPEATRTFAVIKTGAVDSAAVYEYTQTGALLDISESLSM